MGSQEDHADLSVYKPNDAIQKVVSFFLQAGHCMKGSRIDASTSHVSDTLLSIKRAREKKRLSSVLLQTEMNPGISHFWIHAGSRARILYISMKNTCQQ
jgi:hypothetical protein